MSDFTEQTVEEFLFGPCSKGLLSELAGDSEYWEKVESFVEENKDNYIGDLSFKQKNWVINIKTALLEAAE